MPKPVGTHNAQRYFPMLPDTARLFTGHYYTPDGREPQWGSTVAEQRTSNLHYRSMRVVGGYRRQKLTLSVM
ncbi:hypothetical protein [Halomonas sp. GFAJ-1]|uniref:hypothetical protein n=1 Tax=Halomonas sp. GFAJ-1 TaxID=1118153 RepID=UPI00023A54BF|nr:hypothetical protein [Halomonas sp. GFAJ-1]EHK61348.1 Zn-dependent hydrolase [Halomonas sp. GFAJ-1]